MRGTGLREGSETQFNTKENKTSSVWLNYKVERNQTKDELLENYKGTR